MNPTDEEFVRWAKGYSEREVDELWPIVEPFWRRRLGPEHTDEEWRDVVLRGIRPLLVSYSEFAIGRFVHNAAEIYSHLPAAVAPPNATALREMNERLRGLKEP